MPFEIKHTVTGAIFHIAEDDFSVEMTLEEAQKACNELGNGWRLPEIEELKSMHKFLYQEGKGNFQDTWYWESSGMHFNFADGRAIRVKYQRINGINYEPIRKRVRAVRALPKPFSLSRSWRF